MKEIKQAVVLAGGLGTRLKPFTDTNPKPMYEINGVPFIGLLMKQLCGFGITDVLLLLGYMPEKIMN
ncbi:MAG: NTP transferase domain-containing protein, partial [Oscillospiraceae bacterium]|nr:NTP transferase domain-containing protein [Oscillospiraceae bacterium]